LPQIAVAGFVLDVTQEFHLFGASRHRVPVSDESSHVAREFHGSAVYRRDYVRHVAVEVSN